jgi:hypothetical protein
MKSLFHIPFIRAISNDKRPSSRYIEAVLAKTSLSRLVRQAVCDAFGEAGLLSCDKMNAAAVGGNGRYAMTAVDAALAKFPSEARIEIKNTLARCALL